jgi:hypothetical protein
LPITGALALREYIYVPNFRQVGTSDAVPESHVVSGADIIAQVHEMQHPHPGSEGRQKTFFEIQRFVRNLMGITDSVTVVVLSATT